MENILELLTLVGKLKSTKRTGWVYRGVPSPESVSDHMYRMAMMCLLLPVQQDCGTPVNREHCMKLALVHDMAECIVGDITPQDNVSKEDKHKMELEAMEQLKDLADEKTGKELFALWNEYETQGTAEARFVKDLDRFEMILQAQEYETEASRPGWLQEFFDSTRGKFKHPVVQGLVEELNRKRGHLDHSCLGADTPGTAPKTDA